MVVLLVKPQGLRREERSHLSFNHLPNHLQVYQRVVRAASLRLDNLVSMLAASATRASAAYGLQSREVCLLKVLF